MDTCRRRLEFLLWCTGYLDLHTFVSALPRLLAYDSMNTMEAAFRMFSRRGSTCSLARAILDEKDIEAFVEYRWGRLSPTKIHSAFVQPSYCVSIPMLFPHLRTEMLRPCRRSGNAWLR